MQAVFCHMFQFIQFSSNFRAADILKVLNWLSKNNVANDLTLFILPLCIMTGGLHQVGPHWVNTVVHKFFHCLKHFCTLLSLREAAQKLHHFCLYLFHCWNKTWFLEIERNCTVISKDNREDIRLAKFCLTGGPAHCSPISFTIHCVSF